MPLGTLGTVLFGTFLKNGAKQNRPQCHFFLVVMTITPSVASGP